AGGVALLGGERGGAAGDVAIGQVRVAELLERAVADRLHAPAQRALAGHGEVPGEEEARVALDVRAPERTEDLLVAARAAHVVAQGGEALAGPDALALAGTQVAQHDEEAVAL